MNTSESQTQPPASSEFTCPRCAHRDARSLRYCPQCGSDMSRQLKEHTASAWRGLRLDMDPDGVRELLGEPLTVEVHDTLSQIHWFYSPHKMSGARVQFDRRSRKLTYWREPD